MIQSDPAMRKAAIFFARFLAIASGLFVAWEFLGQLYLSSLVIVFNALSGPAAKFAVHQETLAIVYAGFDPDPLILVLKDNDIFFMNILVVMGLLLATAISGRISRRLGWIATAACVVWLTHLLSLVAGEYLAIWDYVDGLPYDERMRLTDQVQIQFPRSQEQVLRAVFERWRLWIRPTMGLVLWFYVARDYLGLSCEALREVKP